MKPFRSFAGNSFLATMTIGVPAARPIGSEILGRIVFQVGVERRRGAVGAHVAHHDGVAVRLGLSRAGDAGGAAGAGHVLDHDLLAERARHVIADDAGDDVGRAAGREGHDHGDRALGIGPAPGRRGGRPADGEARREGNQFFKVFTVRLPGKAPR